MEKPEQLLKNNPTRKNKNPYGLLCDNTMRFFHVTIVTTSTIVINIGGPDNGRKLLLYCDLIDLLLQYLIIIDLIFYVRWPANGNHTEWYSFPHGYGMRREVMYREI